MPTYEINLWLDKKVIEKIIKQFDSDDKVLEYIENNTTYRRRTRDTEDVGGINYKRSY